MGAWQALLMLLLLCACLECFAVQKLHVPTRKAAHFSVALNNFADGAATHFLLLGSSRVRPAQSCLKFWLPGDGRLCPLSEDRKRTELCARER